MKISTINRAISHKGYELIKGKGYFYFWPISDEFTQLYNDSVMANALGNDLEFWVDSLDSKIMETR